MSSEQNIGSFSESPNQFIDSIYGKVKGSLRVSSLLEDISDFYHHLNAQPKIIVDIGAGHGLLTFQLLKIFPEAEVVLVEPSRAMVELAKEEAKRLDIEPQRFSLVNASFEEFAVTRSQNTSPDLVLCHGVIGWVDDPEVFTQLLVKYATDSQANLSLLFGQRSGHLLDLALQGRGETLLNLLQSPNNRLPSKSDPKGVRLFNSEYIQSLVAAEMQVKSKRGVRIFGDAVLEFPEDELRFIDHLARRQPELLSLANMIHLIASP